ncbi:MAG: hypothetical protein V7607_5892 [Solirubrobacteraceae bacterium]
MRTTAIGVVAACAIALGCGGGSSKRPPGERDVAVIAASVADVVYQCQSAAAGFIAGPDRDALTRDVDRLVDVAGRVEADARFRASARASGTTTLREQLAVAVRSLRADCSPQQAKRLEGAVG